MVQYESGGRGIELFDNAGARPLQGAPDPANVEEYVRRCLTGEYTEEPEARSYRSDPAFAAVLTPLNSRQFAAAITAGRALLPRFADFDLLYKWIGAACRSTQQLSQSREVLLAGLAKAKRKSLLLTDMGDTEAQSGNLGGALYWWSQAMHCLWLNPVDCDAYLLLSYVANGFGLADLERLLLERFDSMRAGGVRLDPATAGRLTNLAQSSKTESARRVLEGLRFGYFVSPGKRGNDDKLPPAVAPRELKPAPPTGPMVILRATRGATKYVAKLTLDRKALDGFTAKMRASTPEEQAQLILAAKERFGEDVFEFWEASAFVGQLPVNQRGLSVFRTTWEAALPPQRALLDRAVKQRFGDNPLAWWESVANNPGEHHAVSLAAPAPGGLGAKAANLTLGALTGDLNSGAMNAMGVSVVVNDKIKVPPVCNICGLYEGSKSLSVSSTVESSGVASMLGGPVLGQSKAELHVPVCVVCSKFSDVVKPLVPAFRYLKEKEGWRVVVDVVNAGVAERYAALNQAEVGPLVPAVAPGLTAPQPVTSAQVGRPLSGPPPGWYADPTDAAALCWWDGAKWQPSTSHYPQHDGPSYGFVPRSSDATPQPAAVLDQTAPVVEERPPVTGQQAVASSGGPQVTPAAPTVPLVEEPLPVTGQQAPASSGGPQVTPAAPTVPLVEEPLPVTGQQAPASYGGPQVTPAALTQPATPTIRPPSPKQPMKRWPVIAGVGVLAVVAIVGVVVVPRLLPSDSAATVPTSASGPPASSTPGMPVGAGPVLTAGYLHTCRLSAAGGVLCWGDNGFGQLGDGTSTNRATPTNVVGLSAGVVALSAGGYQTCAVTNGGAVKCWGYNDQGQLGDGTTTSSPTPVDVVGLGAGVRSVAVGYAHTCVVTTGGAVKCWGANESGQLGDGSTTDRLAPVDVQGLASDVVMITAGGDYSGGQTCALKTNGSVVCWGNNRSGQLGDGTTTSRSTPAAVTALAAGVQEISAGDEHVCALTVGGEVQCWGFNLYGQLGNGSTDDQVTPAPVSGLGSGVRALSSGGLHSCAITSAGGVLCWGDNEYGQVGDGTTKTQLKAVPVAGLTSDARIVHAGGKSTCVLTGAGVEQCWGDNDSGELGNGTTNSTYTPVTVEG
jgi:alpha-tubulin suppressor-like RCC1 family protein